MTDDLAVFQAALRRELAILKCPLLAPLDGATIFPRAWRGRATLVNWRRGSSPAEWSKAVRKRHGWCLEIPPDVFLLDLDHEGALEILAPRLPAGHGLVQSSPGRYHVWLYGDAPPGNHIGKAGDASLEVHGPGRLATLPPSLHVDFGNPYRWLRPFKGNIPTRPAELDIELEDTATRPERRTHFPEPAGGTPLHDLMSRFTGQDGRPQGKEFAFRCPRHDDQHASLMVNDERGVFFCHGAGCGFKGNRITLEKLLGLKVFRKRTGVITVEVKI